MNTEPREGHLGDPPASPPLGAAGLGVPEDGLGGPGDAVSQGDTAVAVAEVPSDTSEGDRAHPNWRDRTSSLTPAAQLLQPEMRELLEEKRYRELRDALAALPHPDIADLLMELEAPEAAVAFRVLRRDDSSEVFAHLDPEHQQELVEALGETRARQAIEDLDPDDRARFLEEMPSEVTKRIMGSLSPASRRETQAILGYPPDSVGRLMTPDYVRVRPEWTVGRALEHIRRYGEDAETVHWVFVIDDQYRLIDDLHIRTFLLADPETPIRELMDDSFIALSATDDREEAVRTLLRYDRSALPVLDSRGILLGIVTHDDVADVAEEEATEDFHKQGGLEALDRPYLQTGIMEMLKKRGGWLVGLLVVQVLTIGVLDAFEGHLSRLTVLVVFIPLIIASGGNTGTQAASLLIRALALGEVGPGDWLRIIRRELLTGLVLGVVLGLTSYGIALGLDAIGFAESDFAAKVGLTVGISITGIVVWGVSIGSMLPLILERLRLDPATISSPLVATVMDVSGLVIYLGVATVVLGGALS